jgi:hypothetical protein
MNTKHFLFFVSLFAIGYMAQADSVDRDGIIRDPQGKIRVISQTEAIEVCASFGMHLPSLRELIRLSPSIIIIDGYDMRPMAPSAYISLVSRVPGEKMDWFYYNFENYERPTGDLGSHSFWSSSNFPYPFDSIDPFEAGISDIGIGFDGVTGDVVYGYRDIPWLAARCVANP